MNVLSSPSKSPLRQPLHALLTGLFSLMLSVAWLGEAQAQSAKAQANQTTRQAGKKTKKPSAHASTTPKHRAQKIAMTSGIRLNDNPEVGLWAREAAERLQLDPDWVQKTIERA